MTVARFEIPDGWSAQAFCFALDPSPEQAACLRRQFGGRRFARNWAVSTLKADLDRYHATGEETGKPGLADLRKRWNLVKNAECTDAETGEVWWPQVSKEAFTDGIKGAVDGYWNWQTSRTGKRAGKRAGFPRFAKKGRDRDRVTFTTGAIRVPLETALSELRHLFRERSRRTRGSRRYIETERKITRLHRRVASIRGHHLHTLTSRLAKTHGEIVAEGLDAAGMLRQKGLAGARARRRSLSDSALGETRRQLAYKTGWYGSRLVLADRWYPSSKACHVCGHVQDIGWDEHWTCTGCGTSRQRDDNAAINLARYEDASMPGDSAVGPVGAAVKRRADRKTGSRPAGGDEARKGTSRMAGKQPQDGVPAR
jgi:transposase